MRAKGCIGKRILYLFLCVIMICGVVSQGMISFAAQGDDTSSNVDLEQYLDAAKTSITIQATDGNYYTPEYLNEHNLTVAKGAGIKLELYFDTITGVPEGANLVYQLPENLLDDSKANSAGIIFTDKVKDSSTGEVAAVWAIDKNDKMTVTLDDTYYNKYKHDNDTIDLHGFYVKVTGNLSKERGEHSGDEDAVLIFKGTSSEVPGDEIKYTIPFEYKNEHSQVHVEKTSAFDAATRTVTYTITATTPSTNTRTSENVVIKDVFNDNSSKYLVASNGSYYRDVSASKGSFNASKGVWTIGDMAVGTTATLTYKVQVDKTYFVDENALISNSATATYNTDAKITANNTLEDVGTLTIDKTAPSKTVENGKTYLTYMLTVNAYGADMDGVVVKDLFDHTDAINSYALTSSTSASQGTMKTVDAASGGKTMQWDVGTVRVDTPATLEYKVEVNGDAWDKYGSVSGDGKLRLSLDNKATVYDGNGIEYDDDTANFTGEKIWITKSGSKPDSNGDITYTVTINDNPASSKLHYIKDELSTGTYDCEYITLKIFEHKGGAEIGTYEVPFDKVKENGGSSWKINLESVPVKDGSTMDLSGRYYYTVSYKAGGLGVINNSAGVGVGDGAGRYLTVSTGITTTNFNYSKEAVDFDIVKEFVEWKATIRSTIPAASGLEDYLNPSGDCGAKCGCSYFTKDQIDNLVIKQGDTTLKKGTDYEIIAYSRHGDDGKNSDGVDMYYGYKIKFLHKIEATSSNPVTLQYKSSVSMEKLYEQHDGANWKNFNVVKFYYNIGTSNETYEPEKQDYVSYMPNGQDTEKNYIGYDESTGEMIWYIKANMQTDISGDATITEYIPYGQSFSSANIILANPDDGYVALHLWEIDEKGNKSEITSGVEYDRLSPLFGNPWGGGISTYAYTGLDGGNVRIDYANIKTDGTWTDSQGRTCQKVTIPVTGLVGFETLIENGYINFKGDSLKGRYTTWNIWGRFTLRVKTKLSSENLMALDSGDTQTYTNTAVFSAGDAYIRGGEQSADGTVKTVSKLLSKAEILQEGPAYVQYSMDINPNGLDLMDNDDPITVIDTMQKGMSLATDHEESGELQYFDVYDVSGLSSDQIYTSKDGEKVLDATSIREKGTNVTSKCKIENITGKSVEGMDAADVGKPTYKVTVPDSKHLVVLYWVTVEGSDGETVNTSNQVNFFYKGALRHNVEVVDSEVHVTDSSSEVFTSPYVKVSKSNQYGNAVKNVKFTMYKYVDGVNDVKYATATTDAKGIAYFGHRNDESGGQTIDRNTLYYIVETWAPSGYTVDPTPYYFNFKTADAEEITLDGVDVHKLASGAAITLVNEYTSTQNISVIKKWNDGDDEYGTRPDSITINLYKNGEEIDSKVITADDGWECTFDNMDRYDESGDEITYTVQEEQVEGYQSRISGDAEDGFIITNSYNLKSVDEPTDPDDPVDPEDPTPSKDKVTPVVPTKVVITSRVTKSIPITGDEMGSFLWIVLMVATGSAALGTYTLLKKQKDR